ncbi:MAG: hypothetical protein ACRDZ3_06635 [Acidimicrobiia bacterium]
MKVLKMVGIMSGLALLAQTATTVAGGSEVRIPIGPGADFSVISKTTTDDPLTVDTSGPVEIQFSEVRIAPGGTTGSLTRPGTLVVSVDAGNATLALAGGAGCGERVVEGGAGAIESGDSVSAISNTGSAPLVLHLTSLTPKGSVAGSAAPGCPAPSEQGVTTTILHTSVIDTPMQTRATGTSDVYVGIVRAEPGRSAGPWHAHSAPVFVAVNQSQATVKIAHGGHCEVLEVPAGGGTLEMADMVHEASNQTDQPLSFYILGFAPSPQPLLRPAPTPSECANA